MPKNKKLVAASKHEAFLCYESFNYRIFCAAQPFTPACTEIPCRKYFCANRYSRKGGIMETRQEAIICAHFCSY